MKSFNSEIDRLDIKHAKAEEVRNKIKRDDDCFGVMYDASDELCKRCTILATYNGIEMRMFEICKLMMKFEAVKPADDSSSPTVSKPATGTSSNEKPVEEKKVAPAKESTVVEIPSKAPKPLGKITEKTREKANLVVEAIKAGHVLQSDIAKHLGWDNPPTNQLLRKLIEEGSIVREEKEGYRGMVYRVV